MHAVKISKEFKWILSNVKNESYQKDMKLLDAILITLC